MHRHSSWLLVFVVLITLQLILQCGAQCTSDDYTAEYTQCRGSTHNLVWYQSPSSNCTGGSIPQPTFGLPCNITCGNGAYIPLGVATCTNCTTGTFSRGGAVYIDTWSTWPTAVATNTYCVNTYDHTPRACSGWLLDEFSVRSGNITDSQTSVLEIRVILETAGYVHFSYFVDAEATYDGLNFFVDGVQVFGLASSSQGVFTDFTTPLANGFHLLRFDYEKDFSNSVGEDAAFIQILDIGGVNYAWDTACVQCSPGDYAPNLGTPDCLKCPFNTFAPGMGAAACTSCGSNEYAYAGSVGCSTQLPCTANDYEILSTPCRTGNQRDLVANWLQPVICNTATGVSLPSTTTGTCPPCAPGFYRNGAFQCAPCGDGTAGSGSSCTACTAGTAGIKQLSLVSFNDWLSIESTGCTGVCGSAGWRMRSSYIDSGSGHGTQVQSWFELDLTSEAEGVIYFSHLLTCTQQCKLTFYDEFSSAAQSFNITGKITNTSITILPGPHEFRWTFLKFSTSGADSRDDRVQIFNISVTYVAEGGAPACVTCPPGSVSSGASSTCQNCTAGFSSSADGTTCEPCDGNTFSAVDGLPCIQCGPGTTANSNNTACINTCTFSTVDAATREPVEYDLTPFALNGAILGPLDDSDYIYNINVCGIGNFDYTCHDDEYNYLNTHVCQYDVVVGWALDLGVYAGYYALSDGSRGVVVRFEGGSVGCGPKYHGVPIERATNVTFICDTSVTGVGTLQAAALLESPPCNYNFYVRSLYACPLCGEADYGYYYTACDNGNRLQVYYWRESLQSCYNGVTLPSPQLVPCSHSTTVCPAGQYLDDSSGTDTCQSCLPGAFSIGGGQFVNTWQTVSSSTPLISPFTSFCAGAGCTSWTVSTYSVQSGNGDSSLVASYDFVVAGSVSFNYKVYSAKIGVFQFAIDGAVTTLNAAGASFFDWTSFTSSTLAAGRHQFVWRFTGGSRGVPSAGGLESAVVSQFSVLGTDYHAEQCVPCPTGTYSPAGSSVCSPCAPNTVSGVNQGSCDVCPSNTYSLGGIDAYTCIPKPVCTPGDYQKVFGACVGGVSNVSFVPLPPQICSSAGIAPVSTPCGTCPPTLYWTGSACAACPAGQYYDTTLGCTATPAGFASINHEYYFVPFYAGATSVGALDVWPSGFSTGCSGVCGTPGWRLLGDSVDSGYHGTNGVDSFLTFTTTLLIPGSFSFSYSASGTSSAFTGLQLQVDNQAVPIALPLLGDSAVVSVPLSAGPHTITWNYHQQAGDNGAVQVTNLSVVGTSTGGVEAIPCPAGSANAQGGGTCTPCAPGTFSAGQAATCSSCATNTFAASANATQCVPCAPGTQAPTQGSAYCITSCVFQSSSSVYDLSSLTDVKGPVADIAGHSFYFSFCNVGANNSACPGSHVCAQQGTVTYNNGLTLGFYVQTNATGEEFFSLRFENGDSSTCSDPNAQASTVVTFECDTQVVEVLPRYIDTDSDNCITYFAWRTQLGCPLCTDSDYTVVTSACDGTQQSVTKTRTSFCNGAAAVALPSQACSYPQPFPLAAVLVAIFAFIILVVAGGIFYYRHRKITKHYTQLLGDRDRSLSNAVEMTPPGSPAAVI